MKQKEDKGQETFDNDLGIERVRKRRYPKKEKEMKVEVVGYMNAKEHDRDAGQGDGKTHG